MLANFAADYGKDRDFTRQAMQLLLDARTEKGDQAWWTAEETGVYATGASASVETTGLAAQALLKWGEASAAARKALAYIAAKKDAAGDLGNHAGHHHGAACAAARHGKRRCRRPRQGGGPAQRQVRRKTHTDPGKQRSAPSVRIRQAQLAGKAGEHRASSASRARAAWPTRSWGAISSRGTRSRPTSRSPSTWTYDRTHLAQDDIATATATVKNNLRKTANMVMVDLGIPPGFDLLSEDLQDYQEKSAGRKSGRLEKFSQTATQAILYFDASLPARPSR